VPLDIANYCVLQIDREGASRIADQSAFSPMHASGRAATWETVETVGVRGRPRKRIEVGKFGFGNVRSLTMVVKAWHLGSGPRTQPRCRYGKRHPLIGTVAPVAAECVRGETPVEGIGARDAEDRVEVQRLVNEIGIGAGSDVLVAAQPPHRC